MQLLDHWNDQQAQIKVVFADTQQHPQRLIDQLNHQKIILLDRTEQGDTALAQQPSDIEEALALGQAISQLAKQTKAEAIYVPQHTQAQATAQAILATNWSDQRYKSEPNEYSPALYIEGLSATERQKVAGLAEGQNLSRELISTPANDLNPATMAAAAQKLQEHGVDVEIWDQEATTARGMNLLNAVAAGSATGPRLIRMSIPAKGETKRIVALVGKGLTFDTGGYSIKSASGMRTMKCDMGGAGIVFGTIRSLAALKDQIPEGVEIRAYVAAAENMVGPDAMRPGDIYRAANGKTVEVAHTDAEGRLVLADALVVACDEGAHEVIDLATLTGAKVTALGSDIAAILSNDNSIVKRLKQASKQTGEHVWEMPLHQPYLKSHRENTVSDLTNTDMTPVAGCIRAALFLQEFVSKPWAHIDVAGNVFQKGAATGWGVATMVEFLLNEKE